MAIDQSLKALRNYIKELRLQVKASLPKHVRGMKRWPSESIQMQHRDAHAQLSYLVPMYRALSAICQQSQKNSPGVGQYQRRFAQLQARMQQVLAYAWLQERYFGEAVLALHVPVPSNQAPYDWKVQSLGAIFREEQAKASLKVAQDFARRMAAEAARKAFLKSLSSDQVALLEKALTAAKAINQGAIMVASQDLIPYR